MNDSDLIQVVLADANVLYSRVLRDFLLYAADQEIIAVAWSSQILAEATEHLMANVAGFDHAAAQRLTAAMNNAFPYAEVEPTEEHWRVLEGLPLPDEDDRHVLAASLAAEATVLCTSNTKDFPAQIAEGLGFEVLSPDQLISRLIVEHETRMLVAHHTAVSSLKNATDASTITALERAGAPTAATLIAQLLDLE
ncbi:PIN domain-containing protein [Catenuloplanes sp. NPDC051500]|uniref:PIN domain-containing protein n=1 Tax=Catenuloplanes sp. NPDC051500 TaxID=3363959 RepID=UPI0037A3CE79